MKTRAHPSVSDRYLELIQNFALRPIRNDAEHAKAVEVLIELDGKPEPHPDESDYANTLALLIKDFEQSLVSSKSSVSERLKMLMNEHGMSTVALGDVIGSRTAASMILNGHRSPSKAHIQRLSTHFQINGGFFLE